jgi:hypothetical protein
MSARPLLGGRFLIASRRTGHAPFVAHPALQKTIQSQAFSSSQDGTGTGDARSNFSAPFYLLLFTEKAALQPPVENQQA